MTHPRTPQSRTPNREPRVPSPESRAPSPIPGVLLIIFRMLNRSATSVTLCLLFFAAPASAQGQRGGAGAGAGRADAIPSIADRTSGMKKVDGFFPLYWDEAGGRLFVEVPKLDTEILHSTGFG